MSHVNIEFTLFSAFYSPLIVAMAGGFLKQEGLDYNWTVSPPGKSAIEAIVNGTADVIQSAASQGFHPPKQAHHDPKQDIRHFAQINEMDGFFIAGRQPDPDFHWKKLEGAEVVMFKSGQPNAMFRYACHQAGIDYDKIIPITPGGPLAIDEAFRNGEGQYVQQQGPFPQQLEAESKASILSISGPLIGTCAFSSLAASTGWLKTDVAIAFCRAYRKARQFISEAPAKEIAILQKPFFPETESIALENCIRSYQALGCWTPHIEITEQALDVTQDIYMYTGSLSSRIPYKQICALPPG
ncbi:MAG: hypothetical protein GKR96_08945 [Gammaproteobacteria bacterium]|nr:hypothetical protein [Gammaproteobacteria bacterium]